MKTFLKLIQITILGLGLNIAQAADDIDLRLSPSSTIAGTGDTVSFDLTISGLGNFSSKSLGDFDFDLTFDPSRLQFDGGSLGSFLGLTFGDNLAESGAGILNIAQLSLESPQYLIDNQPGTFSLGTLNFSVLNLLPGQSTTIGFGSYKRFGDENGDDLIVATQGAVIRNPGNGVPAPATWLLLMPGLYFATRKQKK